MSGVGHGDAVATDVGADIDRRWRGGWGGGGIAGRGFLAVGLSEAFAVAPVPGADEFAAPQANAIAPGERFIGDVIE